MIFSLIEYHITACDRKKGIGFRFLWPTGLYRFTLSHCGSCTPLSTLKPHLTALAPRLCTGCSLHFTRCGFPPHYITCTEPAHSFSFHYTTPLFKNPYLSGFFYFFTYTHRPISDNVHIDISGSGSGSSSSSSSSSGRSCISIPSS